MTSCLFSIVGATPSPSKLLLSKHDKISQATKRLVRIKQTQALPVCQNSVIITFIPGQKLGGLTLQEQEDILSSLHPELRGLNLEEIFPHLNQRGLLTQSEKETLKNDYITTHKKIDKLLKWIPTKGSDALARFVICLRNSTDGTGHDELATSLEDTIRQYKAGLVQSKGSYNESTRCHHAPCYWSCIRLHGRYHNHSHTSAYALYSLTS